MKGRIKILIIDCGSKKVPEILKIVAEFGFNTQIIKMDSLNEVDYQKYNGMIISGSPVLEYKPYVKKFNFIPKITIPVLGICFGHQIIGLVFGSKKYKGRERKGDELVKIVLKNTIFDGFDKEAIFKEEHYVGINLPNNFILLANSNYYEVEAMKHNKKNIFGVQFHPEVSGENGKKLIGNFLKLCI